MKFLFSCMLALTVCIQLQSFTLPPKPIKQDFKLSVILKNNSGVAGVVLHYTVDTITYKVKSQRRGDTLLFTGSIDMPRTSSLVIDRQDSSGRHAQFLPVLLEPTEIFIKVDHNKVSFWGSELQLQYNLWKNKVDSLSKDLVSSGLEYNMAKSNADSAKIKYLQALLKVKETNLDRFKERFFEKYPQSFVTALMLKNYVTEVWKNKAKAELYYLRLAKELKLHPDVRTFERGLQIALSLSPGKKFPDLELPDLSNQRRKISEVSGKLIFVDFWASWCGPCRAQSPSLVNLYNKYKSKGFSIVSISFDQNKEAWRNAVNKDNYTWDNLVDSTGFGPMGYISSMLNIMAIPRNFLLNGEGIIIQENLSEADLEAYLKNALL